MDVPRVTERIPLDSESASCTQVKTVKHTHEWVISQFSQRTESTGECLQSSIFSADTDDNRRWRLKLFPRGSSEDVQDYVSLFLVLVSCKKSQISVVFNLSLLRANVEKINYRDVYKKFEVGSAKDEFGFTKFIRRRTILDETAGILENDKLTIVCEVTNLEDSCGDSNKIQTKDQMVRLLDDLVHLFGDRNFTDVIFLVGGRELQAHKIILVARSPVFAAMFQHDWKEGKQNKVEIVDMDFEVVEEMLRFIYTGKVNEPKKMAEELLEAAEKYQLEGLKEICEETLCAGLSVENNVDYLILAELYRADRLKEQAIAFLSKHAEDVKETSKWRSLWNSRSQLVLDILMRLPHHFKRRW